MGFEDCNFSNIGSAYAVDFSGASKHCSVERCSFVDVSGMAVKLGNADATRALTTNPTDFDMHYTVTDSYMTDCAAEFREAPVITAFYVANTEIAYNTITNTPYSAISLGWGWGTHTNGSQTFMRENTVHHN